MKHLISLLLIIFFLVQCGEKKEKRIDSIANRTNTRNYQQVIKVGIVARYSPRLIYQGYQPIMDYLSSHTDYRFELKLSKTYNEALHFIRDDSVQIAFLGTYSYIEAHDKFGAQCILKPLNHLGQPNFRGIIIVRDDSDIRNLSDLKGKTIAFASEKATAGYFTPKAALYKAGIRLSDLAGYTNIEHHNAIVNAVLRGEYDAGAVKDIVAYRNQKKGLRFIFISDSIPSVPIVVRKDADPAVVKQVKAALLRLDPKSPHDKEIMKNWDEEFRYGFVEATDADYKPIRRLIRWVNDYEHHAH